MLNEFVCVRVRLHVEVDTRPIMLHVMHAQLLFWSRIVLRVLTGEDSEGRLAGECPARALGSTNQRKGS